MSSTRRLSKSAWQSYAACLLVAAAACMFGSASARSSGGFGRFGPVRPTKQVWTAAPGNVSAMMSSCAWDGYECGSSLAPIFAKDTPVINADNFPARARAFVAASDLFCSQFSQDKCTWPCQFTGGAGCTLNGASFYQVLNCPGSVLYDELNCISPSQQSAAACLSQPACSFTTTPTGPDDQCTSTYSASLSDNLRSYVFGDLQFEVMPRQLMGCCKGSVYKYKLNNWCDAAFDNATGMATPQSCAKVPGCVWDITTADGCVPSPQTDVSLQFAYKPADPVAPVLSQLAGECRAIKDEQKCNSYKPVAVDKSKVKLYMAGAPGQYNTPVDASKCPLPSMNLPAGTKQ